MDRAPITSETAYYCRLLTRERQAVRQRSIVVMLVCGLLEAVWIFSSTVLLANNFFFLEHFLSLTLIISGALGGIFTIFGLVGYQRGKQPITEQEVSARRQAERARLFRMAQGILPHAYRPWRIVLDTLIGVLIAAAGIACLLFSFPAPGMVKFLYASCIHCIALVIIYQTLYVKPRRAKSLPEESARELKRRLALGEVMGEQGTQDIHDTHEAA